MQAHLLEVPTGCNQHNAIDILMELLRGDLKEDTAERPEVARSCEEVLGTLEREMFDVKMAVFNRNVACFRTEMYDVLMKGCRAYVDYVTKNPAL